MPITLDEMRENIETYVRSMMDGYAPRHYSSSKVVHDSIHGTNSFREFEIAFIDLPIIQRLRRISQIDVASHVFPSGNHNRFEHTLGTATIAGQLVTALENSKFKSDLDERDFVYNHCRVAAILHDCGHGPFSHLSEQYYGGFVKAAVRDDPILQSANPHEILSYLITTSQALKEFNEAVIKGIYNINIDLEFVGEIIVGFIRNPSYAYIVEIVNGAFDSDKLDYIVRDSHCTGLKMSLDISRLFYTLGIQESKYSFTAAQQNVKKHLSVDISGVSTLEQIVFNKMLLTNTVYHHHKVRASGCLLRRAFELINQYGLRPSNLDFTDPVSFLYYTDDSIYELFAFSSNPQEVKIRDIIKKVKYRRLPKRALVLAQKTIQQGSEVFEKILELEKHLDIQREIINEISKKTEELGNLVSVDDIWLDIPKTPKTKEATTCVIRNPGSTEGYTLLRSVFPVNDWVNAFTEYKWKAYVFTNEENTEIVYRAAKCIFEDLYTITLNESARTLCKIDSDVPAHDACALEQSITP